MQPVMEEKHVHPSIHYNRWILFALRAGTHSYIVAYTATATISKQSNPPQDSLGAIWDCTSPLPPNQLHEQEQNH